MNKEHQKNFWQFQQGSRGKGSPSQLVLQPVKEGQEMQDGLRLPKSAFGIITRKEIQRTKERPDKIQKSMVGCEDHDIISELGYFERWSRNQSRLSDARKEEFDIGPFVKVIESKNRARSECGFDACSEALFAHFNTRFKQNDRKELEDQDQEGLAPGRQLERLLCTSSFTSTFDRVPKFSELSSLKFEVLSFN